jgi:hypothetical protein
MDLVINLEPEWYTIQFLTGVRVFFHLQNDLHSG